MNEYPCFLPYKDGRLAVVVSVPDEDPEGVVVLLTGGSAARSHRFKLWTRAARRLAEEHRLASVRLDYWGTGDSTGSLPQWDISYIPVDQARAAARFAMDAVGVDRVAVVGNCIGSRIALEMAARMPECEGAVFIRMPVLEPSRLAQTLQRARGWRVTSYVKSKPSLHRILVEPISRRKKRPGTGLKGQLGAALARGRLLFLYSEEDFTFGDQVRGELLKMVARLPEEQRERFELRMLPGLGLKGFESLDIQDHVIDQVVSWTSGLLAAPAMASEINPPGARPSKR
jgi:pimeloyl-ACP methyl ester carboxylesterase